MKMIKALLLVAGLALTLGMSAQQLPLFSLYQENLYMLNPAFGGMNPWFDVKGVNRSQWTGLTDAPRTFGLSLNGPLRNRSIGVGGHLFTDNVGPTRRTGIQLSGTYHFKLTETIKLGLGLSAGALQFAIDGSRIRLGVDGDPALLNALQSQTVFDASFGALVYSDDWYFGFALPQLLQNQLNLYESVEQAANRIEDHYFAMAGYRWHVSDDWMIEPSAMVRFVQPAPLSFDVSARGWYREMVYAGVSYRHNDAVVAMAGYQWNNSLSIGYAYDMTMSGLRHHSTGTHEIVLGFRFNQD